MSKGSAFTKADAESDEPKMDPTKFDLQRWIAKGKARVVKYVEVYMAAGLEADIRELDAQIVHEKASPADDRLAGGDNRLVELAEQVESLRAEMAESRVVFKFRSLDPGEFDKIHAAAGGDDVPAEKIGYAIFAAQCVQPTGLTAEDFESLADALGEGYFTNTLVRAAIAARDGGSVDVPFSLNASEVLRTRASSGS